MVLKREALANDIKLDLASRNENWESLENESSENANLRQNLSAGTVVFPTYVDNLDGSVTIGNGEYRLFDNDYFNGAIEKYNIIGGTFVLNDLLTNYIIADYNAGNPIIRVVTDRNIVNVSNTIPIITAVRFGTSVCKLTWNEMGKGLSNKLHEWIGYNERLRIESGLSIGEKGTRNLTCTSGYTWNATKRTFLDSIDTSLTSDKIRLFYHVGGVWTYTDVDSYNNLNYDNGVNLVELTVNRYAVNWIFRTVDEDKKILCVVLGGGDYILNDAENSTLPLIPQVVNSICVLIGRVIVQKNENTGVIERVTQTGITASPIYDHTQLLNIGTKTHDELETLISEKADIVQEDWIEPTLLNGSVIYTATAPNLDYYKNSISEVRFRGSVDARSRTDALFLILPAGYRPLQTGRFIVHGVNGATYLSLTSSGGLYYLSGSEIFSLDGLTFRAEA